MPAKWSMSYKTLVTKEDGEGTELEEVGKGEREGRGRGVLSSSGSRDRLWKGSGLSRGRH